MGNAMKLLIISGYDHHFRNMILTSDISFHNYFYMAVAIQNTFMHKKISIAHKYSTKKFQTCTDK